MELKTFVTETLCQIVNGIKEAQAKDESERAGAIAHDLVGWSVGDHLPGVEYGDTVGNAPHQREIVLDEDDRLTEPVAQHPQEIGKVAALFRRKASCGLVEQEQFPVAARVAGDRGGHDSSSAAAR